MKQGSRAQLCLVAAMLCASLTGLAGPARLAALELEVAGDRVIASEDSGAGVAIFGARREFANHMNVLHRHQEVVRDVLVLDSDVGSRSIWVGVDLGTGDWTVHSPDDVAIEKGYAPRLKGSVLRNLNGLELPGSELDLVLIRGQQIWHGRMHDGGSRDESEADGWVIVTLDNLDRIDSGRGGPGRLRDGDVVIGVDSSTLEYFVIEVGANDEEATR